MNLEHQIFLQKKRKDWELGREDGGAILPYVLGDDLPGAVREVKVEKMSEQRHGVLISSSCSPDGGGGARQRRGEVF